MNDDLISESEIIRDYKTLFYENKNKNKFPKKLINGVYRREEIEKYFDTSAYVPLPDVMEFLNHKTSNLSRSWIHNKGVRRIIQNNTLMYNFKDVTKAYKRIEDSKSSLQACKIEVVRLFKKGWKVQHIAEEMGVSNSSVNNWIKGKRTHIEPNTAIRDNNMNVFKLMAEAKA